MFAPTSILRFIAASLVAAVLSLQAGALLAQTEEVEREARRYGGWELSSYELRGMPPGTSGGAKGTLALSREKSWIFFKKYPVFSPDAHLDDLERIRLYLARSGYPWADITSEFKGNVKDRKLDVAIVVKPGPAVRVEQNFTEAFPPSLEPQAESILRLEGGEIFTDASVEERHKELLDVLTSAGYARAEIATEVRSTDDSTKVTVHFIVNAGQVHYFGETVTRGVGSDLHDVVHHTIAIDPGTRYDPASLERAAHGLRLLDLFRKVRLTVEPPRGDTLDILADLDERKPRSISANAGYWTEDQLRASAEWRHRNLLEAGRGLSLDASYSRFQQAVGLSFWKPALFHTRLRGVASLRARREDEFNYRLRTVELELSGSYVHSIAVVLRPSVTASWIDFQEIDDPSGDPIDPGPSLLSLSFAWTYDTLDDKIYPHRGLYSTIAPEYGFPSFATRHDYLRIQPAGTYYIPLSDALTVATRLRVGYALPMNRSEALLPNRRFYAGGSNSVRGFERRMLGPVDEDGDPIGGVASLESSLELQFPLFWILTGAVFVDAGQVWESKGAINAGALEFAAGPGIGVRTPIGPIRADLGYRLTDVPTKQPRMVFHLSIGHAL